MRKVPSFSEKMARKVREKENVRIFNKIFMFLLAFS
jgi:hypothetical protein